MDAFRFIGAGVNKTTKIAELEYQSDSGQKMTFEISEWEYTDGKYPETILSIEK